MGIKFEPVRTEAEQEELATLASAIWNEYWPALIGQAQTDYMVRNFQSLEAIKRDMAHNGYEYWLLVDDEDNVIGYTGGHVEEETNRFFISKVYLKSEERGKGYASQVMRFYESLCADRGLEAMYLTVNKHNDLAIRAYDAKGFKTIEEVETDIGEGFIMDDFIMEKRF